MLQCCWTRNAQIHLNSFTATLFCHYFTMQQCVPLLYNATVLCHYFTMQHYFAITLWCNTVLPLLYNATLFCHYFTMQQWCAVTLQCTTILPLLYEATVLCRYFTKQHYFAITSRCNTILPLLYDATLLYCYFTITNEVSHFFPNRIMNDFDLSPPEVANVKCKISQSKAKSLTSYLSSHINQNHTMIQLHNITQNNS